MIQRIPKENDEFLINSAWLELNTIFQQAFPNLKTGTVYKILNVEYFDNDEANWGITKFIDVLSEEIYDVIVIQDYWSIFGPEDNIRILV